MAKLGLETEIVDQGVYDRSVRAFGEAGVVLPTFAELADPTSIPSDIAGRLAQVGPDDAHGLNLFRVHWYNDAARSGVAAVPGYVELPPELTGVEARIVLALGDRFPMIGAHKVLAAYGCLAPRVVTGQFDPSTHRAVWPSTGNYCRGGVAISRIMGCRGVAVLPEGMSEERFSWLDEWVADPGDIIRTLGSESNVKEIYDKCAELDRDPEQIIFNQFCEFGNHLVHRLCTGRALGHIYEDIRRRAPGARLAAYVSATGSAGTLAAGDHLKEQYGSKTIAVEALECPTLLYNGFGEHNIQGIGDKHVPYIHNVMATDAIVGVSDGATDSLGLLFHTEVGRAYLAERHGLSPGAIEGLSHLGLSSIGNALAAIKLARYEGYGPDDVVITVATDGAAMYGTEWDKILQARFHGSFAALDAAETWGRYLAGASTDHVLEMTRVDRERVFNLGYFTWVEQQGVSVDEFKERKKASFWQGLQALVPAWDRMITEFNSRSGGKEAR